MSWIEWPTSRPKRPAVNSTEQCLAGGGAELLGRVIYLTPPDADDTNDVDAAAPDAAASLDVPVVQGWASWPIDAARFAGAADQALRYPGPHTDTNATEQAWSRQVDAALHGMDGLDPDGLDAWMQVHADSHIPHLHEARLVAAWETHQDHTLTANSDENDDADSWD